MLIELRTLDGSLIAECNRYPALPNPGMILDLAQGSYQVTNDPVRWRRDNSMAFDPAYGENVLAFIVAVTVKEIPGPPYLAAQGELGSKRYKRIGPKRKTAQPKSSIQP